MDFESGSGGGGSSWSSDAGSAATADTPPSTRSWGATGSGAAAGAGTPFAGLFDDEVPGAADGVAGASERLPHHDQIQRAFGGFDLSDVRVETGRRGREASAAMGADAYTTEGRIAFGAEPTLRLAAHEAAHIVQQRGGVQLSAGVGVSGDVYERHADAVADLVVAGQSAEGLLGTMAGGGGGGGGAVQRFDSPHHIEMGDSVAGRSVTVNEVTFTPGELGALVDYVGDVTSLRKYTTSQLREMQWLLRDGNEEIEDWDRVTGGNYSEEALTNEKHFAPGAGGQDYRSMFLTYYGQALAEAASARPGMPGHAAAVENAHLHLYTAEHYLQDAFSAGHAMAATDVNQAVDAVIKGPDFALLTPLIAEGVYARCADTIRCYGLPDPMSLGYAPIDSAAKFVPLATVGGLFQGQGGFHDGVRRFVHEKLADLGVEVSSPAHPQPWTLKGDHTADKTSVAAMQAALDEVRKTLERGLQSPVEAPMATALEVFTRHCPVPTPNGQANVTKAISEATKSDASVLEAMIDTTSETIEEAMDYVVSISMGGVVELSEPTGKKAPWPVITPHDPGAGAPSAGPYPPSPWPGSEAPSTTPYPPSPWPGSEAPSTTPYPPSPWPGSHQEPSGGSLDHWVH